MIASQHPGTNDGHPIGWLTAGCDEARPYAITWCIYGVPNGSSRYRRDHRGDGIPPFCRSAPLPPADSRFAPTAPPSSNRHRVRCTV